jgi:hypothetical protein
MVPGIGPAAELALRVVLEVEVTHRDVHAGILSARG